MKYSQQEAILTSGASFRHNALEPYISAAQLRLHHDKHHAAYVNGANAILERLDKARQAGTDVDMKATLKELSFQAGGHVLHSLFWSNLSPASKTAKVPSDALAEILKDEFGPLSASRRSSLPRRPALRAQVGRLAWSDLTDREARVRGGLLEYRNWDEVNRRLG